MTKREIIEEVMKGYIEDPSTRGIDSSTSFYNACTYYDSQTGNKCAVGKCLDEEFLELAIKNHLCGTELPLEGSIHDIESKILDCEEGLMDLDELRMPRVNCIDDMLAEKYRGHSTQFWAELQTMHDGLHNFDEKGLTETGEYKYKKLLEKWG
jgi:hypothetical protein